MTRVLAEDKQVLQVERGRTGIEVLYAGTHTQQAALLTRLVEAGVRLTQFTEKPTDIEDLFLRLSAVQEGM